MIYSIIDTVDGEVIYGDSARSCIGIDTEFQAWLRKNKDNLPNDIQAKIDSNELTIQEEDG